MKAISFAAKFLALLKEAVIWAKRLCGKNKIKVYYYAKSTFEIYKSNNQAGLGYCIRLKNENFNHIP